jgi:hypothetical protein
MVSISRVEDVLIICCKVTEKAKGHDSPGAAAGSVDRLGPLDK